MSTTASAATSTADAQFTAFVAESGPRLHRTARLLTGDGHRAEELVQATLVKTYLAWPRAVATDPEAYARRVLANQRIDTWRKDRREVLTDPAELPDSAEPSSADDEADRDEVLRALMTLTPRQRRIVVLRHLVGLTDTEVAADLGVSVGTVKSTSSRALTQLRAELAGADDALATRLRRVDQGGPETSPARSAASAISTAGTVHRRRRRAVLGAAVTVALVVGAVVISRLPLGAGSFLAPATAGDYPAWASYASMAQAAGAVVEAEVLDVHAAELDIDPSVATAVLRYDVYRIRVLRDYAGTTAAGDVLEIKVLTQEGAEDTGPDLAVGTRYVLFLSGEYPDGVPRDLLNPSQAAYEVAPDGEYVDVTPTPGELLPPLTQADLDTLAQDRATTGTSPAVTTAP